MAYETAPQARASINISPSLTELDAQQAVYDVGNKVQCLASFDQLIHPSEILEKRINDKGDTLFYVHYLDCDKRMDEWVSVDRLGAALPSSRPLEAIPLLTAGTGELKSGDGLVVTRRLKRKIESVLPGVGADEGGDHGHDNDHSEKKVKNVQVVELGRWEMDTWYYSPYPEPYASQHKLYICEYDLKYFRKKKTLLRHLAKLDIRHPPGDEIYRSPTVQGLSVPDGAITDPQISVFEVDGKRARVYCQNLCLLSKLFLDHKTLYFDVDPFLFYVLCERDEQGNCHIVGYFSKEKQCQEEYNLACILTLPCYQRKGYGKFLMAFAYELSRREGRIGTPERPLSDLGQVSFRSYWSKVLLEWLRNLKGDLSIKEASEHTMIHEEDIRTTLESLGLLKYWRGQHLIHADPKVVQDLYFRYAGQKMVEVDPACLHWTPLTPTVAPRKPKF